MLASREERHVEPITHVLEVLDELLKHLDTFLLELSREQTARTVLLRKTSSMSVVSELTREKET